MMIKPWEIFPHNAFGRDTWPDVYRLQNEIEDYGMDDPELLFVSHNFFPVFRETHFLKQLFSGKMWALFENLIDEFS